MVQEYIKIRGARQHNLKNVNLDIPKGKLVVLTGMSGSGKSSLAFDTLYAEGQRRYVESLSSYARQFLGVMSKPDVDLIEGLSPAISIDQKTTSHNPRSTVGTITEIYDYLRLLFARVGHPHCPKCGREIAQQSVDQIADHVIESIRKELEKNQSARFMVMSPVVRDKKGEFQDLFQNLIKQGYQRVRIDGTIYDLHDDFVLLKNNKHTISAILDRFVLSKEIVENEELFKQDKSRLVHALEQALKLSDGLVMVSFIHDKSLSFPDKPKDMVDAIYSEKFMCSYDGTSLPEIEPRIFSFNTPHGACETCNGLGTLLKIDPDRIVARSLSLSEGAIIPFAQMFEHDTWFGRLVRTVMERHGTDERMPFEELPKEMQRVLLYGDDKTYTVFGENRFGRMTQIEEAFPGFIPELERRYKETDSEFIRMEIEKYMRKEICPACNGKRLKPESLAITIDLKNIADVTDLSIRNAHDWVKSIKVEVLSTNEQYISGPIIKEISSRLSFLDAVGLNYLTLSREASTLAGGEAQRIRLASQIGTGLSGVLYVLDEPTIGLHQRDNQRLIATLKKLRDVGNSVVVVEHDKETMLEADYIVDFGPRAGKAGGEVVAQGTHQELENNTHSITGQYLSGKKVVSMIRSTKRQESGEVLNVRGATEHNLKSLDVDIPLRKFVCITGVSGSGKSTLLYDTIYTNLAVQLGRVTQEKPGDVASMHVPSMLKRVALIDQSPIGKTPRSNPATYTKIFDLIRNLYAQTQDARTRGYSSGRFSFNVKGGRCEACQGEGQIKIEMQFLADMYVTCDVCHGSRYNSETLQVRYRDKNIAEVLAQTVDEAIEFFGAAKTIQGKLRTLQDVGLGYIQLGQPAPTLSGGESQRVKLAKELSIRSTDHTMYLLDEPTTGLHFEDIQKLLQVLDRLVEADNTVVVIEHNLDVVKNADWIIDLGPEGGDGGGEIVGIGTPQDIVENKNSVTGSFLKQELRT
ncbi:MAG TPA: excinuclease ABC subunit UvrA [Candidatus Saccharimonadia bacterium]|nr:excinuclease ABC subunit UvrA [Candidatus Saccharimonadia bacterium]